MSVSWAQFYDFPSFLVLRLQITCLRTLGTKFLPLVSLIRPLESSFLVLLSRHNSSDVLDLPICMISS